MSGIPLGRALTIAQQVIEALQQTCAGAGAIEPVADLRRFEPLVRRLELGAAAERPEDLLDCFVNLSFASRTLGRGPDYATVLAHGAALTLRATGPGRFGSALVRWTGQDAHLRQVRRRAAELGVDLGLDGPDRGRGPGVETEAEVYAALGLPLIPPELRHGTDELDAAVRGLVATLVAAGDIRGDLHVHSNWSDGRDEIETIVAAARAEGYEYVAITDHSPYAGTRRSVDTERLLAQAEEVMRVRDSTGFSVLHGVEVDILPSGDLDLPDAALAQLDIVLASLHHPDGQGRAALTERYLTAIRHPLVDVITHPLNRVVGYHDGYKLDLDRIFEAAAETGTVLEIDGAPMHLDMDGSVAQRAVAAGVRVTIDSDCHDSLALGRQMRLGLATARRGWVQKRDVLNTLGFDDLRDDLTRRRTVV